MQPHHPLASSLVAINAELLPGFDDILTPEALDFLFALHQKFDGPRRSLLQQRETKKEAITNGWRPHFLPDSQAIRLGDWKVAPVPADLQDRRVEITGPVDRKMIINALNSGAKVFMADFEDANSPTWANCIEGQINLRDAVKGSISFFDSGKNKSYFLQDQIATLMVRPRGWHLEELHLLANGQAMSGSLVDFGLFFFHNARQLLANGSGPYFYLPKLENHHEARLWNDVFVFAQSYLGLPLGTIKATVLIETILASFELDEILYELRDHSAGLNCGRWDYIFSYIKKFGSDPAFLVPDRAQVTMSSPFMTAYSQLVIKTCHRRGAHAMGGMAAQIPIKDNPEANAAALNKVRADKKREATAGHDGTWVAHPGLVPVAMEVFDEFMPGHNQLHVLREDVQVSEADLLAVPHGTITEAGLRNNIEVGIRYLASWLCGNGCVPIFNLMEDAATAEISRTQVWQWLHHPNARMEDGREINRDLFGTLFDEEVGAMLKEMGEQAFFKGKFDLASRLFRDMTLADELQDFLTLEAYRHL